MLKKLFNKKNNSVIDISTLNDLLDSRGKLIAEKYCITPGQIFPYTTQLNEKEYEFHWEGVAMDLEPSTFHGCYYTYGDNVKERLKYYQQLYAAAAVMSYELTKREKIQFLEPLANEVVNIDSEVINKLKHYNWLGGRSGGVEHYDLMGQTYEKILNNQLDEHWIKYARVHNWRAISEDIVRKNKF